MSQPELTLPTDQRMTELSQLNAALLSEMQSLGGPYTQESLRAIYSSAVGRLLDVNTKFSKVALAAKNVFSNFFSSEEAFLTKRNPRDYNLFASGQYIELREKRVIVPLGLNVSYLDHLKTLYAVFPFVEGLLSETLIPLKKALGSALAEPHTLASTRVPFDEKAVTTTAIDKAKALLAKDFSRDRAERRPYGSLVARQKDWDVILKNYNELIHKMDSIKRQDVMREVSEVIELLDVLNKRIQEDPETYAAGGITARALSSLLFNVASQVEFYSYYTYGIESLGASIDSAYDLHKAQKN